MLVLCFILSLFDGFHVFLCPIFVCEDCYLIDAAWLGLLHSSCWPDVLIACCISHWFALATCNPWGSLVPKMVELLTRILQVCFFIAVCLSILRGKSRVDVEKNREVVSVWLASLITHVRAGWSLMCLSYAWVLIQKHQMLWKLVCTLHLITYDQGRMII